MIGKVTVDFVIDAESLRDAVKMLDVWLVASDDERLIQYEVQTTDWPSSVSVPAAREP